MNKFISIKKKISLESIFLLMLFCVLFIYFISQPEIYSHDTYSYFRIDIKRYPLYIVFLRVFDFVFKNFFEYAVVAFQLFFAFISIFIFYKNFSQYLKLNFILKFLFLAILVFPLFPPLLTANNLSSEGLSYPLYILLISFLFDFLIKNEQKKIYLALFVFILLTLTRGQFIVIIPVLILLYILKFKHLVFKIQRLKILILIVITPLIVNILDSSYRKIVHGYFIKTPYSYINAVTMPLYLSSKKDSILFKNEDHKALFLLTYNRIDSLGLLSTKVENNYSEKYKLFHDNFPKICNQSFHFLGKKYFFEDNKPYKETIKTEKAAKKIFMVLFLEHITSWLKLYFTSVFHGFGSIIIFIFFLFVAIFSGFKTLRKFDHDYAWVLFSSLLILSNALIVAIAVHSIVRYSFYNFILWFIIIIILSKKIFFNETRT